MISTAEATAFLDYFCYGAVRTDHAVMIDAPWGAGKTHFIKAYLQSHDAEARAADALIGAPYLYASLYGVSSLEEVREQFFSQAFPVLSSAPVKMIGTALAGVMKKFTGAEIAPEALSLSKARLEAKILVFDDLERAAMPLVDALGLINSFVEHDDHKVIIIANQLEVPADQRQDYERQREKVIGRTLTVRADPSAVLPELIADMRCEAARAAVQANSSLVIRLFEVSETHNLRSLRAALAGFDRLVGVLDAKLSNSPEALQRLLAYIVSTEIEYRTGLSNEALRALISPRLAYGAARTSEAPEVRSARQRQAKYPDVEWRDAVIPAEALADYIVSGVLDIEAANQAILIHPLIAEPRAVPAWRRLIDWQMRGATAFTTDRADVLQDLADHAIVEPGEICHVAGIALWLEAMGAPLLGNVEQDMGRYIAEIEADETLRPNLGIFRRGGFNDVWAGFGFCYAEDQRFVAIKSKLRDAVERRFGEQMRRVAPALLEALRQVDDDGDALYASSDGQSRFGSTPILHHLPVADFADLMVKDGRANGALSAALSRRYQYWGRDQEMLVERPWLETLKRELDSRAEALGSPFETALKKGWTKLFDEMFAMMAATADLAQWKDTGGG